MKTKKQLIDLEHKGNEKHHFKLRPALLSLCMLTFIGGYSQTGQVNLNLKNATVKELFREIEKQTSYRFSYRDIEIDNKGGITISGQGKELKEVLTNELAKQQLSYVVSGNKIIVSPTKKEAVSTKEKKITGKVIDAKGEPVIGATIMERGTTNGTITDFDGNFTLNVSENSMIEVSYIGYQSQSIKANPDKLMAITLKDDSELLDEVVVVGYGTQKKVNLTGSVATMKVDEALAGRSITNAAVGLQGMLPGLAVTQNSGMAGGNDINLTIRGLGTVNNTNPLVVVDGMPDVDINRINMDDIESVTVLKDAASAAVYGSRAANGVILITTRTGKGHEKSKVSVSSSLAIGKAATDVYPMMNDYARVLTAHQKLEAVNKLPDAYNYKNGTIDQWMAMSWIDPFLYPNTDWWDVVMRDSKVWKTNASVSGTTDRFTFYFSLGTIDEDGLQINNDYKLYNARLNAEYKIKDNMNIGVKISGNWSKWNYIFTTGFADSDGGMAGTMLAAAGVLPYDPESGRYGGAMAYNEDQNVANPYSTFQNRQKHQNRQEFLPSIYFNWEPIKGLTAQVDYSMNYYNQFAWDAFTETTLYDFQNKRDGVTSISNPGVSNKINTGYKTQFNGKINYHFNIKGNHDINIMALYSQEYWYNRNLSASRKDRIHDSMHEIDAALENVIENGGASDTEGLRSVIGRINYAAYDRYLFEASLRGDASSKFIGSQQWGFFPSFSVGWRFREESFFEPLKDIFSNGKFRFSYGSLGNNSGVGKYEQQETLTKANYILNQSIVKGFVNKKLINPDLSWEKTSVMNVGLDLGFFNNRLSLELDYYDRLTSGMNRPSDLSIFLEGLYNAPRMNIGKLRNRGFETNITWNDHFKDFQYRLNFNISYNRNKLEEWNERLMRGNVYLEMPYHFVYGYEDYGIAQSWADIYNTTPQNASPGDILLKDINGDGKIDGNDQIAKPNSNFDRPNTNFGFNFNLAYKGFDLSGLLNGALGRKTYWISDFYNNTSFSTGKNITWDQYNNWWSWDNREGPWPRQGASGNSRAKSSSWLDNMNYLRLKNLQVGYTLKGKLCKELRIESIRFYGSAENIFTITSYRGIDPERGDVNSLYPLVRSFSFGFNVNI